MTRDPDDLPLAAEFPAATHERWRALVDGVLKGARFEDRLTAKTADGLVVDPLYPRAAASIVGHAPRGRWQVMARIDHPDPDACNAEVLHELNNGANALALIPAGAIGAHGYGLVPTADAIERALAGVHLDAGITIALEFCPQVLDLPLALARLVERRKLTPATVDIRFGIDPIGALARHGRLAAPWPALAPRIGAMARDLAKRGFKGPFAAADGRVVHDAGGSEAQELAFALATAVAYLRAFEAASFALDDARRLVGFRLSADADQFLTVAKFRALRALWRRVEDSCGLTPVPALVEAETAWRTMTRDDPYANLLRATIAVFSAGIGGADAISVLPFTATRGLPDRFARRVARNTQLVLLEEAGIGHVADPTAGTGWSEDLTGKLCRAAWALFQEIEATGGVATALERGLIQRHVSTTRDERVRALSDKRTALIGASEYPAVFDVPVLDVAPVTLADLPAAVTCEPLVPVRLAAPFERATP